MALGLAAAQAAGGQFKAVYEPIGNGDYAELRTAFMKERLLETLAADLNGTLRIPADIDLALSQCGETNAFYDPQAHRISLCYELLEHFNNVFQDSVASDDELTDAVMGASFFVFFHELGHSLIDILDLLVTGREEDVVDQRATYILTDGTDEGEQAALHGALSFYLQSAGQEGGQAVWDEHSLDEQRFYNIVCWVYGENPDKYADVVKDGVLPEGRAVRCPDKYARMAKSRDTLLQPCLKHSLRPKNPAGGENGTRIKLMCAGRADGRSWAYDQALIDSPHAFLKGLGPAVSAAPGGRNMYNGELLLGKLRKPRG